MQFEGVEMYLAGWIQAPEILQGNAAVVAQAKTNIENMQLATSLPQSEQIAGKGKFFERFFACPMTIVKGLLVFRRVK